MAVPSIGQVKYSAGDKQNIYRQRKVMEVALKDWDRKKLYKTGLFFESIYNKYRDTSMNAAIRSYTIAASSESEYLDNKECYKAANRLAQIYETGKGVPIQLHRAMIYYYLGDATHRSTYNTLGNPAKNAAFQRIKKNYCARDIAAVYKNNGRIDSLVIEFSPFCRIGGRRTEESLQQLASYLRQNPERTVVITVTEDYSVPAAQYTLKVNNFLLQESYRSVVSYMLEKEGISADRFLPMKQMPAKKGGEYQMIIKP